MRRRNAHTADWLIDLGPEGGSKGGRLIAVGTPEQLAENADSYTGQFLKPMLAQAQHTVAHEEFDRTAADAKFAASLPKKKDKPSKPRGSRLARPR